MRRLTRNAVLACVIYVVLVGGFAVWQTHAVTAAGETVALGAEPSVAYGEAMRHLGLEALFTLALVGGGGLAFYLLLARRGRELSELLEAALAGQRPEAPPVKDDFSAAFAAVERVGRELHLERERGARAQDRLSALSLLVDVGVLLVSPDGRLAHANPRASELLGCTDAERLRLRWPELRPLLEPTLRLADERATQADVEVPTPEGPRTLRCLAYPLAQEEQRVYLVLLRDRMVLDALETDLLLASQLRALSRIYRAVTHDLKAPLNAMALNLDRLQSALRRGEGESEAAKTEQYVRVLREEMGRLDRSLEILLAETTPAGGGRQEFDARAMVQEIERLLEPQARLQHVAFETHLPGVAVRIAGQRDRLKQAILNVAINALDAMAEGGALEMRLEAHAEEAEVLIGDSGPGIPEEVRSRIFDAHFTTKTTGTGIGLYLARSIVEAHGGEITVETAPGQGSTFRLRLPTLGREG
jgi:signal transduction histidine kinase